jgi:dCMP deaminase
MKSSLSYYISIPDDPDTFEGELQPFASPSDLLDYVTEHWEDNFVTIDLKTKELVEYFVKRPFFLLVSVDAPLYQRYQRSIR